MMKTLKQLLEAKKPEVPQPSAPIEPDSVTAYVPKTKDEKRFMDKHVIQKHADRNGNGDDHFRATNINVHDRSKGHGYNKGEDQKVYESKTLTQILGEKKLTPAEMKKREEIAGGIDKSNPNMPMAKKMAIATAKAKQVAEQSDLFDVFAEDIREEIKSVFESLDEDNQQIMIEMIEAEDYDTIIEVVKEVSNG